MKLDDEYDASGEEVRRIRAAVKAAGYALTFRIETGGYELHPAVTGDPLVPAFQRVATAARAVSRTLTGPSPQTPVGARRIGAAGS